MSMPKVSRKRDCRCSYSDRCPVAWKMRNSSRNASTGISPLSSRYPVSTARASSNCPSDPKNSACCCALCKASTLRSCFRADKSSGAGVAAGAAASRSNSIGASSAGAATGIAAAPNPTGARVGATGATGTSTWGGLPACTATSGSSSTMARSTNAVGSIDPYQLVAACGTRVRRDRCHTKAAAPPVSIASRTVKARLA